MQPQKVVIKKYENRRLYDTAGSRYVNLDEVAQMVRDGMDVQVVDAGTGEDLTRLILTQIIVEDAKGQNSTFPLDVLRQMVMASGAIGQEALLKYMKSTVEMYQNAYRAFTPPAMPLDFMQQMMNMGQAREVDELRRRVAELEKLVAEANSARSNPKKSNTSR